jgi:ADP-glucose pyrophosphorylase
MWFNFELTDFGISIGKKSHKKNIGIFIDVNEEKMLSKLQKGLSWFVFRDRQKTGILP